MARFILRRLLLIPVALLAINFVAFAYAHLAQRVQLAQNPFGSAVDTSVPIVQLYGDYLSGVVRGNFGTMPLVGAQAEMVSAVVWRAAGASLGLAVIAFTASTIAGLLLGVGAVQTSPPRIARWLPPLASAGLAAPSFFIGALGIALVLSLYLRGGEGAQPILPMQGFGWDAHLILPVLALSVRPTMQIAQTTSGVLMDELGKQYVVAARSRGTPMRKLRWKHVLRNVLPAVILTIAASFRLMVGELIVVEWLFGWPGMGRLLALALLPPSVASIGGGMQGAQRFFLYPELVAAILTIFGFLFLMADMLSTIAVHAVDPRLRVEVVEPSRA
jgi:peptide/nickel transport system permease protein